MRLLVAAIALVGVIQSETALAAAPERLEPSSPWNVHYDDDSCALRRAFGPPDRSTILELRQYAPDDSFTIFVGGKGLRARFAPAQVRFEPDDEFEKIKEPYNLEYPGKLVALRHRDTLLPNQIEAQFGRDTHDPDKSRIAQQLTKAWFDQHRAERESAISGLTVLKAFNRDFTLATGPMADAMDAMRSCTHQLLTHWGLDAAAHKSLSREVEVRDYEKWVKAIQSAYPPEQLSAGQEGVVNVRLIIGTDGKPKSCNIQLQVKQKEFGQTACARLAEHAMFEPALDAQGRPIDSYYTTTVFYMLEY